jgi:glutaredoxin
LTRHLILLTAFFFIFCATAQADFYKWEDENGNMHITDYPPPAKSGIKAKIRKYDSAPPSEEEKQLAKTAPDVVLYTKDSCADCDKAREFLKSKNIPFTEYNIDTNREAAQKRKALDGSDDAPFLIFDKSQVYGFSESVYTRILKIKP